jgi:hypothetical protein
MLSGAVPIGIAPDFSYRARAFVSVIKKTSLSRTLDGLNAVHFDNVALGTAERRHVALWIAGRQGLPGAYGGTFAGLPAERTQGIVLFTGERIQSASARHILGEEASRALRLLRVSDASVTRAIEAADAGLLRCLARAAEDPRHTNPGLFCCGKCSVGLWRNLLAGGLDRQEERLQRGAGHLRAVRDGAHGWRRFPFWYVVLALSEMDDREARGELKYAAAELSRVAKRAVPSAGYARRRHQLAVRALTRLD